MLRNGHLTIPIFLASDSMRHKIISTWASEISQNCKNWASAKNWDIAKGYTDADIDIVMRCGLSRRPGNYDLIFSAIPDGRRVPEIAFGPLPFVNPTNSAFLI